jgi:hypothetical protein
MSLARPEPKLSLRVLAASLELSIANPGSEPVRVWQRHNSWGWETLSLVITPAALPEQRFTLVPKPGIFTRDGPGFVEIAPKAVHQVSLRPGDPEWQGLERIAQLREEAITVRAVLRIPPTPEARDFDVFVGEVSSPAVTSKPPHRWLFNA